MRRHDLHDRARPTDGDARLDEGRRDQRGGRGLDEHEGRAAPGERVADEAPQVGERLLRRREREAWRAEGRVDTQGIGKPHGGRVTPPEHARVDDAPAARADLAHQRRGAGSVPRGEELEAQLAERERPPEAGEQRVRAQPRAGRAEQRERRRGREDLAAAVARPRERTRRARVQRPGVREKDEIAARGRVAREDRSRDANARSVDEGARLALAGGCHVRDAHYMLPMPDRRL